MSIYFKFWDRVVYEYRCLIWWIKLWMKIDVWMKIKVSYLLVELDISIYDKYVNNKYIKEWFYECIN